MFDKYIQYRLKWLVKNNTSKDKINKYLIEFSQNANLYRYDYHTLYVDIYLCKCTHLYNAKIYFTSAYVLISRCIKYICELSMQNVCIYALISVRV